MKESDYELLMCSLKDQDIQNILIKQNLSKI